MKQLAYVFVLIGICALVTPTFGQEPPSTGGEERLFVNQQRVLTPGFAVGNIAIGDPSVADFKVMPDRREVLLIGTGTGRTTLTLWDQQNVKRGEFTIAVSTETADNLEIELRDLLWDFPSVEVRTLAGSLVLRGTVTTLEDLEAVQAIAEAGGVRSLVRVRDATRESSGNLSAENAPPDSSLNIEYELELLETDVQFGSGSYATGIEPSGRQLFFGTVSAVLGEEGRLFIGGTDVFPDDADPGAPQVGVRLTLQTEPPDDQGAFTTHVQIETNLPYDSDLYDREVWRRARWDLESVSGEPMGIAGVDLMAIPTPSRDGPSALRRIGSAVSTAGRLPGVSSLPGSNATGAGRQVERLVYFNEDEETQLILLLRPRLVQAGTR